MSLRTAIRRAASECACGSSGSGSRIAASRLVRPTVAARQYSAIAPRAVAAPRFAGIRAFSTTSSNLRQQRVAWASDPIVEYDELKPLTLQPTDDILVVDVRDPDEVALGSIPSAVNLPLSRIPEALDRDFNPGAFKNEFAFPKPLPDQKIIFFCRSGKRSATAAEIAEMKGYPNTRNYVGSMLDWAEHEGLDPEALGL